MPIHVMAAPSSEPDRGLVLRRRKAPSLLVESTEDALGNRVVAVNDYRLLRPVQVTDPNGSRVAVEGFDYKGNPLRLERRLARDYRGTVDWSALLGQLASALDAQAAALLEAETFFGTTTFDALSRPIEARLPDGTLVRPAYNAGGVLEVAEARIRGAGPWITFLENHGYDARRQRLFAAFGNGTRSRYSYCARTYRLARLETRRTADDALLQDLRSTYDPIGDITEHADEARQARFFDNAVVRPESRFEYDAIYQLVRATGRGSASSRTTGWDRRGDSLLLIQDGSGPPVVEMPASPPQLRFPVTSLPEFR